MKTTFAFLDKKALAASVLLGLLLVSRPVWGECVPSAVVRGADVTMIEKTNTGECLKTDAHVGEDELRGHTVTLQPEGSANSQGKDTTFYINKDGMRFDEKGGQKDSYGQFGGEWPDDEHTRRLPKPDMPLAYAGVNQKDHHFTAVFQNDKTDGQRDVARMKAYAEKLKARGFTIAPKEGEKAGAQGYYSYRAKNGAGYMVQVTCMARSFCALGLSPPEVARKREADKSKARRGG